MKFLVHYTDGSTSNATSTAGLLTLSAPVGKFLDWIDVFASDAASSNKIDLTSVGVQSTQVDINLAFTAVLKDGDGDSVSGGFTVHVVDGGTPQPVAPVVIDLDGDGAEFVSLSAGVAYDYDGNGAAQGTAWVGADDGLLVHDANGDGLVNGATEFVFGSAGVTDLQGLAARYGDTLDAHDADFASFGVWQDANGDGISQAGEFRSLSQLGIRSIDLVSNEQAGSAAGGDVTVHGQAVYTRADGTTGIVADASFATGNERVLARSQEIASTTIAASVLAGALVTEAQATVSSEAPHTVASPTDAPVPAVTSLFVPANDSEPDTTAVQLPVDPAPTEPPVTSESHSTSEETEQAPSAGELDQAVDHPSADVGSSDQPAVAETTGSDSPFAASDAGSELMQGLLLLAQAPQQAAAATPEGNGQPADLGAVQEALADAHAEGFVDSLVAQHGTVPEPAPSAAPQAELAGLLGAQVGSDHVQVPGVFDVSQMVEEAHALAAA
jgi:hypothetical protein